MDWQEEAIVLGGRRFGESGLIVSLFTRGQGRHKGLLRGGTGRRLRGVVQPGARVDAHWRGRLADHLGTLRIEPIQATGAVTLADPLRLAGVASFCAIIDASLPEREPLPRLFDDSIALLGAIESDPGWPTRYIAWEVELLADLGFGLDLRCCAVSGRADDLTHVSPRTGRAVTAEVAEPYADRLLVVPPFLVHGGGYQWDDIAAGLRLTGHFLERHVFAEVGAPMPAARAAFVERVRKWGNQAAKSPGSP